MYQNFARFFDRKPAFPHGAASQRTQKDPQPAHSVGCGRGPFLFSRSFFLLCLGQFLGCGNGCGGHLNGTSLQQRRRTGGRAVAPCRDHHHQSQHPACRSGRCRGRRGKGCSRAAQPFLAGQLLLRAARILYVERRHHRDSQHCAPTGVPAKAGSPGTPGRGLLGGTGTMQLYSGSVCSSRYCGSSPTLRAGSAPKISTATRSASSCAYHGRPPQLAAQKSRRALHRRVVVGRCSLPQRVKACSLLPAGAAADAAAASPGRQAGQTVPLHGIRPEQRARKKRAPAWKQQRQQRCARHLRPAPLFNRNHSRAYRSVLHGTAPDRHP